MPAIQIKVQFNPDFPLHIPFKAFPLQGPGLAFSVSTLVTHNYSDLRLLKRSETRRDILLEIQWY